MMQNNSFLSDITPVILTYNEAANIQRALEKLTWANEIIVVDSGSTDGTLDILKQHPNVRCLQHQFESHSSQWNYAIKETGIKTEWVLALDSDYILSDDLIKEVSAIPVNGDFDGYETEFRYCIWGKPLRATLYPPVVTLYRHGIARYLQDGHTQRLQLPGPTQRLKAKINHDDRKPLSHWLWSQDRYARLEVDLLLNKPASELRLQDRLRRMVVIAPWLVPLYCLTCGRGLLDGWAGIYYALQRGIAESVLALKLLEASFQARRN